MASTQGPTWEFMELSLPRDLPREDARQMLTASVERGNWELDQSRVFRDGRRRVRLRRRVYRMVRTA
jgi:hypothetical protein